MKKKVALIKEKRSRTGLYWAIFLCVLMISSGLSIWGGGDNEVIKYNGYKYIKTVEGWKTYKEELQIDLKYNPLELENLIGVEVDFSNYEKVYFVDVFPESAPIIYEFNKVFGPTINKAIPACSKDLKGCEDLPLKSCSDSSSSIGVVLFEISEESNLSYEDNCLIIRGKDTEKIIKMIDKSALVSYGLI